MIGNVAAGHGTRGELAMPQCSQCTRPALYGIGDPPVPLCLHCWALHSSVIQQEVAMHERAAERALDDMEMVTGVRLPRRRPQPQPAPVIIQGGTFHNINIRGSNVGVVNTGDLQQVDTAVTVIGAAGDEEAASAIKSLTEAVLRSAELNDAAKREAVELLAVISAEATQQAGIRRAAVARPLIGRLRELIGVTADVATVAQAAMPAILAAFGLS